MNKTTQDEYWLLTAMYYICGHSHSALGVSEFFSVIFLLILFSLSFLFFLFFFIFPSNHLIVSTSPPSFRKGLNITISDISSNAWKNTESDLPQIQIWEMSTFLTLLQHSRHFRRQTCILIKDFPHFHWLFLWIEYLTF